jgi:glucosamine-6-phosphate deaminase
MGRAGSEQAAQVLRAAIQAQGRARIIVASAPSQDELIAGLAVAPDIDWSRVTVFHMDEYVGLAAGHSASFRHYQQQHLLAKVRPAAFHGIRGEAPDPAAECRRNAALLAAAPIDLVCLGIGENGHIAFNDPAVADFDDPQAVKIVELDAACRQQQVNDGCFADIGAVPLKTITLTCPALLSGECWLASCPAHARRPPSTARCAGRLAPPVRPRFCVGTPAPRSTSTMRRPVLLRQRLAASQPSQAGRVR